MGISIHFKGKLESEQQYHKLRDYIIEYAGPHDWKLIENNRKGKAGLILNVDNLCEPIFLEFDKDWQCGDFVQTQFAGVKCHIEIIEFFREIQNYFVKLELFDEGEYWDTNDRLVLEKQITSVSWMIIGYLIEKPYFKSAH